MSSVCHSYALVCHPYAVRMYSCVIRYHSYLHVCHPYVTRTWFYHEPFESFCETDDDSLWRKVYGKTIYEWHADEIRVHISDITDDTRVTRETKVLSCHSHVTHIYSLVCHPFVNLMPSVCHLSVVLRRAHHKPVNFIHYFFYFHTFKRKYESRKKSIKFQPVMIHASRWYMRHEIRNE